MAVSTEYCPAATVPKLDRTISATPFQANSSLFGEASSRFSSPSAQFTLGAAAQLREQQKQKEYERALEAAIKRSSLEESTQKLSSKEQFAELESAQGVIACHVR